MPYVDASKNGAQICRVITLDDQQAGSALSHCLVRTPHAVIALEDMPSHLIKAFLAANDDEFYSTPPFNLLTPFVRLIEPSDTSSPSSGKAGLGSHVTRIATSFLANQRSTGRMRCTMLVFQSRLENTLSKDQILSYYLNHMYLGRGKSGVESASRVYFGKHAGELTLAEAACLASLSRFPSRHDPSTNGQRLQESKLRILTRMLELRYITQASYDEAKTQPLIFRTWEDGLPLK